MKSVSHQQFLNRKPPKRQRALDSYCPNCGFRVSQHQREGDEWGCPQWLHSRVERENVAFFAEEEVKEQVRGFMQSTSPTRKRVRSFFYCVKRAVWVGGGKFSVRSVTLDYMISKLKDIDQHKLCPRRVKALKAYLIQQALKGDEQCPF